VKPQRPSETDLLALVQNGFNAQLPKDREAHGAGSEPPPSPLSATATAPLPGTQAAMVRITLTIPEDLRFQLKMALMNRQRSSRSKMTQDEFCARAIQAQLAHEKREKESIAVAARIVDFLQEALREKGLTRSWASKAKCLLEASSPTQGGPPS